MIDSALVSFGGPLLGEAQRPLRDRIVALSQGLLKKPLLVNTVFEMLVNPQVPDVKAWFLLLDFNRFYLYDDPLTAETPRIGSIARFIVDDYPFQPFELLAAYVKRNPFRFLHDLERLDMLPLLLAYERPGKAILVDFITAEVRICGAQEHPDEKRVWDPPREAGRFSTRPEPLTLRDQITGSTFRASAFPDVDDFAPSELGVIRAQRDLMSESSLPESVTRLAWSNARETFCGAKSLHPREASIVARCEAIERIHSVYRCGAGDFVYGTFNELQDVAIDPETLFFRVARPRATSSPIPHADYTDSTPMYWTWAHDVIESLPHLVPAQEIWFDTERLPGETICTAGTTNGCAVGGSIEEAALFALLEAVERDAFLTSWYLRRDCDLIDPDSVRFEPFRLLWSRLHLVFPDYRFHLFDITTDIAIPAVWAVAVRERGNGPRTLHSAAAGPRAERALFAALKDIAGDLKREMQPVRLQHCRQFIERPELIRSPDDHRDFYSLDESFDLLSFLDFRADPRVTADEIDGRSLFAAADSYNLKLVVDEISRHLNTKGIRPLFKETTHAWLLKRGVRCVKAIVPGLHPMWFGYCRPRFSITGRLQALARRFNGRMIAHESDVNLEVHPLS